MVRSQQSVREAFQNPSTLAKPWCFWYWMNGCVSKEGIVADLDAMKEAGLGGAYIFSIRGVQKPSLYEPALQTLSPEWWAMIRFTLEEAGKRNLQMGLHISDGFALAGGPWIKPEQSMQKVVWVEQKIQEIKKIKSGKNLNLQLPQPETNENFYRDIAVYAYPAPSSVSTKPPRPDRISAEGDTSDLSFLTDAHGNGTFRSEEPVRILYEYKKPFLCRSIVTKVNGTVYQCHRFKLEASDDGVNYCFVAQLEPPRHGWQNTGADVTHAIPPTKARFFRFSWTKEGSGAGAEDLDNAKWKPTLKLTGLYLSSEPKIHHFEGKNGSVWRLGKTTTAEQVSQECCVDPKQLLDISKFVDANGVLTWKAPKGNWILLRMGHTSTGSTNATGGAGAGLECDKFSATAVQSQFDHWFGKACNLAGPELVGKVLKYMHIDSWECGSQNWSMHFADEFLKRRGYDLKPWLPVMAGVPVGSVQQTEKVLYDVRRTISELVNDVFYRRMVTAAHAKGCQVSAECVAPTMTSDGMLHYQSVDQPMGEFWLNSPTHDKPNDMLDAISGAHIYGKNLIQAEGFTQLKNLWEETPSSLKPLLDGQYSLGLNRFFFHVFVHNPFLDRKPGMTLSGMGLFFQRDQTWWKPAKAWMEYLTRCQSLLQLGHPVADIAVFGGLELPGRALTPDRLVSSLPGIFGPERVENERIRLENKGVPVTESPIGVTHTVNILNPSEWLNALRGYQYDTFNPDVLFRLAKAENGRIILPGGASYRLLVMPQPHPMSPDSITPYTEEETRLRDVLSYLRAENIPVLMPTVLAADLKTKPQIPWMEEDFSSLGIPRDLEIIENGQSVYKSVGYCHRAGKDFDLYFLTNQKQEPRTLNLSFRVTGKIPEIYDPLDGSIRTAANWKIEHQKTRLSLKLEPGAALFVVFEKPTADTIGLLKEEPFNTLDCPGLQGPWAVRFDTAFGGPAQPEVFPALTSWSKHQNPDIQHYSGTALYTGSFTLNAPLNPNGNYLLNLGKVADIAEVFVNGQCCGTAWTAPWTVDVSNALKSGQNLLEIRVTNTWANRLEGDASLPVNERTTWTDGRYRKKTRNLLEAGLLGPLKLTGSVKTASLKQQQTSKNN
jgi:hypothetical protein